MPTCVCGEPLLADHRFCAACGREQVSAWGLAAVEPPGRRRSVVSTVTAAALALMVVLGVAFAVGYRSASLAPQVVARFIPGPFATPTSSLVSQPPLRGHALATPTTHPGKQTDPVNYDRLADPWRKDVFDAVARLVKLRTAADALAVNDVEFIHVDFDGGKRVHGGVVVGRDPAQDIAMVRSLDGLSVAPLPLATDGPAPHPEQVVVLASTTATNHSDRTVETLALLGQSIPVQGEGLAVNGHLVGKYLLSRAMRDAGFKVNVQATPFSALIPSLTSNKIDIIAAAMLITVQRKEVIDFSDPVFPYPEGMVVAVDDNTPYKSLADLKGQVVGAQVGTVYIDFLKKSGEFAEVKVYDSLADILRDVSLGRIKAGFGDAPILKYQLAQNANLKAKLVASYEPKMAGSVGIGVRKTDQELLKKINASLAKLQANGTVDKILVKWSLK